MWDVISKRFLNKKEEEKNHEISVRFNQTKSITKKSWEFFSCYQFGIWMTHFFRLFYYESRLECVLQHFINDDDSYVKIAQKLIKHATVVVNRWMNFNDAHLKTDFLCKNHLDTKNLPCVKVSQFERFNFRYPFSPVFYCLCIVIQIKKIYFNNNS